MDHSLQIHRNVDDYTDATMLAMEATGVWARTVASNRLVLLLPLAVIAVGGAVLLWDPVFAIIAAVAAAIALWVLPRVLRSSVRRRLPKQMRDQLHACTGQRTLWITDAGLSDSGSGITVTVAWDRLTHHLVTPERHVFLAGLAAVIDVPRRGNPAPADHFAALAAARMPAVRTTVLA